MKKKNCLISQKNKKEIFYNIINSLLAGSLVLLGAMTSSGFNFSWADLAVAFGIALIVIITKFKNYWDGEASEYSSKTFNFIP